jgi:hypothetical protein
MTLLNILLIGTQRAGTTLLDRLLEAHRDLRSLSTQANSLF